MRGRMKWFSRKQKATGPDWWRAYTQLSWQRLRRKTPLDTLTFVVLDTEATGRDATTDRLLSLSAIRVDRGEMHVGRSLELVIQQADFSAGDSIPIHGIKPGDSEAGIPEAQALQRVVGFVGNAVIVGHHIGFDLRLLDEGLKRLGLGPLRNDRLDTAQLAVRAEHLFPNPYLRNEDYTLDALCVRYHVRPRYRHTASGDAFITGVIFLKLLARLQARGITTWGGLR